MIRLKAGLLLENDDHLYSLKDCIYINQCTGIPIVFDNFHYQCLVNNTNELKVKEEVSIRNPLQKAMSTWRINNDGLPMVDYSGQDMGTIDNYSSVMARKGKHSERIDIKSFKYFIKQTKGLDFDIMLEIKDKEISALKALEIARKK